MRTSGLVLARTISTKLERMMCRNFHRTGLAFSALAGATIFQARWTNFEGGILQAFKIARVTMFQTTGVIATYLHLHHFGCSSNLFGVLVLHHRKRMRKISYLRNLNKKINQGERERARGR
jgi:hypothetical protein